MTKSLFYWILTAVLAAYLSGCSVNKPSKADFSHTYSDMVHPWNKLSFQDHPDQFTFAITSDLYGGERPGIYDVAIAQLNLLRPAFIMTVGDLIDGGTEDKAQLNKEWDTFDQKADKALSPVFYVGGNHDLTNTTMREVWQERLGSRYYHFIYKNALFLVIDSEDYSEERMQEIYVARAEAIKILDGDEPAKAVHSQYYKMEERRTGFVSDVQNDYFKKVIESNPDVRWTFLFMHKPVWMREGPGGLSTIESYLSGRPYTVFNGHFHTYSYTERLGRDYIRLGTTGGAQNAESEMAFDHITMVTVAHDGPAIANIKLEGMLDKSGHIPAQGDTLCFQASNCKIHSTH